jgi:hypothetical protein
MIDSLQATQSKRAAVYARVSTTAKRKNAAGDQADPTPPHQPTTPRHSSNALKSKLKPSLPSRNNQAGQS